MLLHTQQDPFRRPKSERQEMSGPRMIVGCVVLLLVLAALIGLVVLRRRMQLRDANRKCHLSLIFFLSGFLLFCAVAIIGTQAGHPGLAQALAFLVLAGLGIPGFIFAILGLSEVKREGGIWQLGKGPAITTLVLSSLLMILIGGSLALGFAAGALGAFQRKSLGASEIGVRPPEAVFKELGFSVYPPEPWLRIDAAKIGPDVTVAYMRSRPEVYFAVIAEKMPAGHFLQVEQYADAVKTTLAGAMAELKVVEQRDDFVYAYPGMRLVTHGKIDSKHIAHRRWLHVTPEFAYQLIAWGPAAELGSIVNEGGAAFETFRLIE